MSLRQKSGFICALCERNTHLVNNCLLSSCSLVKHQTRQKSRFICAHLSLRKKVSGKSLSVLTFNVPNCSMIIYVQLPNYSHWERRPQFRQMFALQLLNASVAHCWLQQPRDYPTMTTQLLLRWRGNNESFCHMLYWNAMQRSKEKMIFSKVKVALGRIIGKRKCDNGD